MKLLFQILLRHCFFLLLVISTFECKGDLRSFEKIGNAAKQYVPIVRETIWKFIGNNNQVSTHNAIAKIECDVDEIERLEKFFAASGVGSVSHSMEELEKRFEKVASRDFTKIYASFLGFIARPSNSSDDLKVSLGKFAKENSGYLFEVENSKFTFPVTDTINGIPTSIKVQISVGDILEKQNQPDIVGQILRIESPSLLLQIHHLLNQNYVFPLVQNAMAQNG